MAIGAILWGVSSSGLTYENTLAIGYPLYDVLTDRELREGSEQVRATDGSEDGWTVGRDFVMDAEVRWIDDSPAASPTRAPVGGPGSWQDFLDYARAKNPFRFVPDVSHPGAYVDGCYLVDPISGFGSNQANLQRAVRIKLRNSSADFIRAIRGVLFEDAPSRSIFDPIAATFSRPDATTCATYYDANGFVRTVAANILRDKHFLGGVRTRLLEGGTTNLVPQSESLVAASGWTVAVVVATAGIATAGDLSFTRVSGGLNTGVLNRAVAFTGDGTKAVSFFVQFDGSTGMSTHALFDGTELAYRAQARVTWAADGTATCAIVNGTLLAFRALGGGVYRIEMQATGVIAANVNQIYASDSTGATAASVRVAGVMAENSTTVSSYLKTTAAAVTRAADSFTWPFAFAPQETTFYLKFVELGTILGAGTLSVLVLGGGTNPRIQIRQVAGDGVYQLLWSDGVSTVSSTLGAGPSYGDTVELRGTLSPTGIVQISQSINGAAEVTAAASAALALPTAWSAATLYVDSETGGLTGFTGLENLTIAAGTRTLAQMRAM